MKVKELTAGIKLSKDFNSHQLSMTVELDEWEDNVDEISKKLLNKCERLIREKLGDVPKTNTKDDTKEEKPVKKIPSYVMSEPCSSSKLVEIGAAWKDKKFPDTKLSCKHNNASEYKQVMISELEKTDDGYIYETDQEKLFLKVIPEEKRTNPKMPHYKIFKEEPAA